MSRLSGANFEDTDFANPTGSVQINRGNTTDTMWYRAARPDSSLFIGEPAANSPPSFQRRHQPGVEQEPDGFRVRHDQPAEGTATWPLPAGSIILTTARSNIVRSGIQPDDGGWPDYAECQPAAVTDGRHLPRHIR